MKKKIDRFVVSGALLFLLFIALMEFVIVPYKRAKSEPPGFIEEHSRIDSGDTVRIDTALGISVKHHKK